jgi:hypothetical protein
MAKIPYYRIRAMQMHDRVMAVRSDIINNHLANEAPYPIKDIFQNPAMRPTDEKALTALVRRRNLVISNMIITNDNPARTDTIAPFQMMLDDKFYRVLITVPEHFKAQASLSGSNLTLDLTTPLTLSLVDIPEFGGRPITASPKQQLKQIYIDDFRFELTLKDFGVRLLLTDVPDPAANHVFTSKHKSPGKDERAFDFTSSCTGSKTIETDGYYVIKTPSDCQIKYLKRKEQVCSADVYGPYVTEGEAGLIKKAKCPGQ